ncbi:MAG: bifunctional 5,10-methylene-tetrahydrofolate dehydrogenase/5,10-methylene-tetrahydrofolate cyclohydrolase [Bacteroidetes bacterium 4484_276]|nr:MAG: bifunctional 5,10-methylene-tetrahydrofolate dehydrogenase/5,10-methylene-tetrahydrofolate cyclohydrolase [Bacteroidetes bacterium 4484_276]
MKLIDGKKTAGKIKEEIKIEVSKIIDDDDGAPHLVAILVGDDPASETYVAHKETDCKQAGIISSVYRLNKHITERELLDNIEFINEDDEVHGLIVQLPLPRHINVDKVISAISPEKDVDGFHPLNVGNMMLGQPTFLPATPAGILELLKRYKIETEGKHCVVLGRSNIVGTPMSVLLSRKASPGNCTVTMCHSKTKNIPEICREADILIAAIGQAGFVTADMVKEGAVVIDVGIHRVPSDKTKSGFRLIGDVKFDEVSKKCSYITPVPGGVGPMTRVALLQNTLRAFKSKK